MTKAEFYRSVIANLRSLTFIPSLPVADQVEAARIICHYRPRFKCVWSLWR